MEPAVSHVINERLEALKLIEYEAVFAGADAVLRQQGDAVTLLAAAKAAADQHLP